PNLAITLGLVSLIRCLVISSLRQLQEPQQLQQGGQWQHWIAVENKWLATRHGLAGMCIPAPGGTKRQLAQDAADLITRLLPIAQETGDHPFLAVFGPIEKFESGAARQRRIYREAGNWRAVVYDLKLAFTEGLEGKQEGR